jgi:uncharacterized repeat protein (TIGR01451 family)
MSRQRDRNIRLSGRWISLCTLAKLTAMLCIVSCFSSTESFAAGTAAGTVISNRATVTFNVLTSSYSQDSNTSNFVVDDKVMFVLTSADSANVTVTPGGRAYMTYTLNNTGNAPHDFTLGTAVTGIPTLSPATGPVFYADAAGTIPLPIDPNAGNLPYVSSLAPDGVRTVYLYITAPPTTTSGQTVAYNVTAEAYQPANLGLVNPPLKSATQAASDASIDKNTSPMTQYVVLADAHGNGGDVDRDGRYAVIARDGSNNTIGFVAQSAVVNTVKAATVADLFGGSQPLTGATIHYTLTVTASGTGSALGVVITDPVPANTTYTAGTLKLNGSGLSDGADADAGDVGATTPGAVTVRLGNMTSATPVQTISFDVKIN